MRAEITRKGLTRNGDTVSIFDNDKREIAIRRTQIAPLIKLLRDISKREYGEVGLEYLETCGVVW